MCASLSRIFDLDLSEATKTMEFMDDQIIEKDMNKTEFLKQLKLQAIIRKKSWDLEKRLLIPLMSPMELKDKNNEIVTGYENYHIALGKKKMYPCIDFVFIGKNVICQKCYQRFASKFSYKAHVYNQICDIDFLGPNHIYRKFKNRHGRHGRRKFQTTTIKTLEDIDHDIKRNLLRPEVLNTLQTRRNCYSDIVHNPVKPKVKSLINYENGVKRPRGRPRKNVEAKPIKQDQPKQLDSKVADIKNSRNLKKNLKDDKKKLKKSRKIGNGSVVGAYNNVKNKKHQTLSSSMKSLTIKFWNVFNQDWKCNDNEEQEGKNNTFCIKDLSFNLEGLKSELKIIIKQFKNPHAVSYKNELLLMLSKLEERLSDVKLNEPKKTHMHSDLTTGKGKENINCLMIKEISEIDLNVEEEDFDSGLWVNSNIDDMMNEEDSTSQDVFENNLETLTEDTTQNCTNSVQNHLNNVDLNHIHNSILECKTCEKRFASVGEWKIHRAEHVGVSSKQFLCKICGLKFKVYKNYSKHMSAHNKTKNKNYEKNGKRFKCKKCNKEYNFLALYYSHIKTHVQES